MSEIITVNSQIIVGISSCLLGDEVRYNGGHKLSRFCKNDLSEYFQFQKFCPEVTAGFGIPRPTLRLTGNPESPTLSYTKDMESDVTLQLQEVCDPYVKKLEHLDGYILQQKSPSCGMARIKVFKTDTVAHQEMSAGLFAKTLMEQYPHLPIEEEGRLHDHPLRENFIERVYAHHHFRTQVAENPSYSALIEFHSQYKYVLMAHNQQAYRELGRMLAESSKEDINEVVEMYFSQFMQAMKKLISRGNHYNTMLHVFGYVKKQLNPETKQLVIKTLDQYLNEEVNLATAMTLLDHYIQLYGSDYIQSQRYLDPYPAALGLRNRI